ncbi:MAG: SPOR domain-containing protein [Pseudoflavonifractor sp.]|nr:SPOR domain-containing protein [Pseudoflavonifractor sp.]
MRLRLSCIASVILVSQGITMSGESQSAPIVEHITAGTENTIDQPETLAERLMTQDGEDGTESRIVNGKMAGYRIQVFSDNNPRTAKSEARAKSRNIGARFPQYRSYVSFHSPFWRVRIGDFRTEQDAREAAQEIKNAFPSYRREVRVVRDRINAGASY